MNMLLVKCPHCGEAEYKIRSFEGAFNLTVREVEVANAMASTAWNERELALVLGISTRTLKTHEQNIYRKTSCSNRLDFIIFATHRR